MPADAATINRYLYRLSNIEGCIAPAIKIYNSERIHGTNFNTKFPWNSNAWSISLKFKEGRLPYQCMCSRKNILASVRNVFYCCRSFCHHLPYIVLYCRLRNTFSEASTSLASSMSKSPSPPAALENLFFNSSPSLTLYQLEVCWSLVMPAGGGGPLAEKAYEFQTWMVS